MTNSDLRSEKVQGYARRLANIYEDRRRHVDAPYPRAVRAAILGDRETTLEELHEAARRGFTQVRILQQDLALRELHGSPEFDAVIAEVQRRTWIPVGLDLEELAPNLLHSQR